MPPYFVPIKIRSRDLVIPSIDPPPPSPPAGGPRDAYALQLRREQDVLPLLVPAGVALQAQLLPSLQVMRHERNSLPGGPCPVSPAKNNVGYQYGVGPLMFTKRLKMLARRCVVGSSRAARPSQKLYLYGLLSCIKDSAFYRCKPPRNQPPVVLVFSSVAEPQGRLSFSKNKRLLCA